MYAIVNRSIATIIAPLAFTVSTCLAASSSPAVSDCTVNRSTGYITGSYHITRRRTSSNGVITMLDTYQSGSDFKTTATTDGLSSSWGSLDGIEWTQDENGFVSTRNLGQPAVSGEPSDDSPVTSESTVFVSGKSPQMLVTEKSAEQTQRRFYNANTCLLQSKETYASGHVHRIVFEDYRWTLGHWIAFRTLEHVDNTDEVATETDILSYTSAKVGKANLSIPNSRSLLALDGQTSGFVPAQFVGDTIVIAVIIGGKAFDFLLDSGSPSIVIDKDVMQSLNIPIAPERRDNQRGSAVNLGTGIVPELYVGGFRGKNVVVDVPDQDSHLREKHQVVGLLGSDFLASAPLLVDYQAKVVRFLSPMPTNLESQGWVAVPLELYNGLPIVSLTINDAISTFLVDLGSSSTIIGPRLLQTIGAKPFGPLERGFSFGGAASTFERVSVDSFKLGGLSFSHMSAETPIHGNLGNSKFGGILGRDVLRNLRLIFDYGSRILYIRPKSS